MPIMSQITCSGSGPASSATSSPVPSGCSAIIASTSRRARSRTDASVRATTLGVNALLTMLRSRRCRGSSSTIIDPKNSASSGFWSGIVMDGRELKRCGCRLTCHTSSYLVSAQCPGPDTSPSWVSSWWNAMGWLSSSPNRGSGNTIAAPPAASCGKIKSRCEYASCGQHSRAIVKRPRQVAC